MSNKNKQFRADINGLRAIAVLSVVLYHFGLSIFQGGFIGVDIFFVISGFLMSKIIFTKINNNRFNLLQFYIDRGTRIIPALAIMILAVMLFGWFFVNSIDYRGIGKHAATSITFLSNFIYWKEAGYFDSASHEKWLLHTWSLSVEWQFYILYPLLVLVLRKVFSHAACKTILVGFTLLSFTLSILLSTQWPTSSFYLLHTRAWEMLLGGLVFLFPIIIKPKLNILVEVVSLTAIIATIVCVTDGGAWPGFWAVIPVLATAAIISCNNQNSIATANPIFQQLGTISYSVYLWHWPIVVLMKYIEIFDSETAFIVGIVCSLLLGQLSYSLIESTTRKFPSENRIVINYVTLLCTLTGIIAIAGSYIYLLKGFPERLGPSAVIAAAEANNMNPKIKECLVKSGVNSSGCSFGNTTLSIDAIVLGDSHAMSMMSAIYESNTNDKKHMLFFGYSSCPTIRDVKLKDSRDGYACSQYLDKIIEKINFTYSGIPLIIINRSSVYLHNQSNPDRITSNGPLIYFDIPSSDLNEEFVAVYREKFISTLCELSNNRQTYIVESIPEMKRHVPKYMEKQILIHNSPGEVSIQLKEHRQRSELTNKIIRDTEQLCGTHPLDPTQYFCTESQCFGSENGRPLYFDGDHLSEYGNKRLIPMFEVIWKEGKAM